MPIANRKAGITAAVCVQALAAFKLLSIPFDNGQEFTQHPTVAAGAGAGIYFADAYQSNQRARNENNHGLVRQFLPSVMPLDQLNPIYVRRIERALNSRPIKYSRPRKSLGWKTLEQVYLNLIVLHFKVECAKLLKQLVLKYGSNISYNLVR